MASPIAPDYGQQFLFPPALEDWVAADHPARFLREFVDQLDLAALGFAIPAAVEGRPPYHPSLLLKIWLYGYYHRIRSTRKLETACCEPLSLLWLSGLIQPDHNSLWRFWRDNKKALRQIFKQTVQVAVRTGAVGLALQALDGTKIQAAASTPAGWSKEYMEKLLAQLDGALDDVELKVVEENTDVESPGYRLPAGLAERQALREQIKTGLAQLAADGRKSYHPVEPKARPPKTTPTPPNTLSGTPNTGASPVLKAGRWLTKATPSKTMCGSNAFAATTATVRCVPNARATPKAGSSKCARTPPWSKRCVND